MDQLDREIEAKRRRRDEAKRLFDQLDLEVRTLEYAASLRPTVQDNSAGQPREQPRRGGKPPGSISMAWRQVLANMLMASRPMTPDEVLTMADLFDMKVTLPSVRDRMRSFEQQGFVSGSATDGYTVTQKAIEKFGLRKLEGASSEVPEEAP